MRAVRTRGWTARRVGVRLLCAGLIALCALPSAAQAEFSIEGEVSALRVEATEAPIEEIFAAIGAIYGVTISATRLPDRPVTGVYSGPLQRVVAGMLDRYDYVLTVTADTIEISYLQSRGQGAVRLAHQTGKLRSLDRLSK